MDQLEKMEPLLEGRLISKYFGGLAALELGKISMCPDEMIDYIEGILLIIVVLFVPQGIMGTLGDHSGTTLRRLWRRWFGAVKSEIDPHR